MRPRPLRGTMPTGRPSGRHCRERRRLRAPEPTRSRPPSAAACRDARRAPRLPHPVDLPRSNSPHSPSRVPSRYDTSGGIRCEWSWSARVCAQSSNQSSLGSVDEGEHGDGERDCDPELLHAGTAKLEAHVGVTELLFEGAGPRERLSLVCERDVVDPGSNEPGSQLEHPAGSAGDHVRAEAGAADRAEEELGPDDPAAADRARGSPHVECCQASDVETAHRIAGGKAMIRLTISSTKRLCGGPALNRALPVLPPEPA